MPKMPKIYLCELCDFKCIKKSNLTKHFTTNKHINCLKLNKLNTENAENAVLYYNCKYCKKKYKIRNSLWYHEQKCSKNNCTNDSNVLDSSDNIINLLIKENTDFKSMVMDLVKNNTKLQEQMLEVCQKIQPTTINANSINSNNNNKTFNLQFFLNEQCKNAMNLNEFVDSFEFQVEDLLRIGRQGYVEGISHLIIEKLKSIDVYKRPIHCSDLRRDMLYIRTDDIWCKEGPDKNKISIAIKDIGKQNFPLLDEYRKLHPDCLEHNSEFNDPYVKLIMQAAGGCVKENVDKIIKNIMKQVVIEK